MAGRNGFVRKKVRSLTLGERITSIRSERRLTLIQISRETGIQTKYLEAIERGEYGKLPSNVYVHGFLRAYAKYLGESPDKFIAAFERERSIAENLEPDDHRRSHRLWQSPKPLASHAITPRVLLSVGSFLLVALGFWYVQSEFFSFVSEPQLFISSPEDGVMTWESSVVVSGRTDASAEVFLNDEPILVDEEGEFSDRVEIGKGPNTLTFRAVNAFDRTSEKTVTIIGR